MNTPLRRVAIAVMVMIVALLANATYVQVIQADSLRNDPRNSRVLLDEYGRQRGQISASGQILAVSVPTDDRYKYLRTYPPAATAPSSPLAYAPATGFYSLQYGSTGLERSEDAILNGSDNRLFGRRFFDLFSGRDPRGGNVVTTSNPAMQQVAYDQMTDKGYKGAVVAIEPSTGKILTMVSTPSYDPNLLASHDGAQVTQAWEALSADPDTPMLNRAVSQTYPPGSTFKVLVTAAALQQRRVPRRPAHRGTADHAAQHHDDAGELRRQHLRVGGRRRRCGTRSRARATRRSSNSASRPAAPRSATPPRRSASDPTRPGSRSRSPTAPSGPFPTTPRSGRRASASATSRSPRCRTRWSPRRWPTAGCAWNRTWSSSCRAPTSRRSRPPNRWRWSRRSRRRWRRR